jgi:hypothetical protein
MKQGMATVGGGLAGEPRDEELSAAQCFEDLVGVLASGQRLCLSKRECCDWRGREQEGVRGGVAARKDLMGKIGE